MALRTQQILAQESGVAQTVDPLAGSYYVESLTSEHRARGSRLPRNKSIRWAAWWLPSNAGWVQREIEEAAYRHQQAVDAGETVVVGCEPLCQRQPRDSLSRPRSRWMKPRNDGRLSACGRCARGVILCAGGRRSTGSRSRHGPRTT